MNVHLFFTDLVFCITTVKEIENYMNAIIKPTDYYKYLLTIASRTSDFLMRTSNKRN